MLTKVMIGLSTACIQDISSPIFPVREFVQSNIWSSKLNGSNFVGLWSILIADSSFFIEKCLQFLITVMQIKHYFIFCSRLRYSLEVAIGLKCWPLHLFLNW